MPEQLKRNPPLPEPLMGKVMDSLTDLATESTRTIAVPTADGGTMDVTVDTTRYLVQAASLLVKATGQNLELDRRMSGASR